MPLAKVAIAGVTMATVFVISEIKVHREPGEEVVAISALRAVASAQRWYASFNGGYATSLKTLTARCAGEVRSFLSPDFSSDPTVRRGYEIRLRADADEQSGDVDCHGNPMARTFYATASPLRRTATAMRGFAVDQNDVIWYDPTGAAPKPPFAESLRLERIR